MRKNKGITLIALVITIIVLLILAGVALSMVAGNEGILTKAEKAVNETNIAGAKEQVELMIAEISADYYEKKFVDKTESGNLVNYIKNALATTKPTSNGEFSVSIDGSGNVSVTDKGGNSVVSGTLDENGKIIWDENAGGNGGGSGEVNPEETDAKYFTFVPNEDGTTATITGVKDEYAEKVEGDGFTATLVIKDGENYIKDVVLPSKIKDEAGNEYTVTAIGEEAFYGDPTGSEMSQFTSFVIPDTVESIGMSAFGACENLNSVTLGSGVTSIGYYAFRNCTSLSSINIPDSVTSIEGGTFSRCTSLSTITVAEGNTVYDSRDNSNAIIETATNTLVVGCKNTNIPESVTSIGYRAFYECISLSSINIHYSVTSIEQQAFALCTNLSSINIPYSVTSIEGDTFEGCTSLSTITVAEGNTVYDSRDNSNAIIETATNTLVVGCKNTNIPESVTSIGDSAFSRCTNLSSINIPDNVTSIGEWAFFSCTSLSSINIPEGVTSIGDSAFNGCTSLSSINIPDSVTSIGSYAFRDCTSLTSITIDSATIASGLTSQTAQDYLINYATTIYVKSGLTVGSYVTTKFTEVASDKDGYVMYTKN